MATNDSKKQFRLEEATISSLHDAIRSGQTTCVAVVEHYIARARAYNGVASMLVTADGASVPEAAGAVRAQAPLRFPTETIKASEVLPDLEKYRGAAARIRPHGADRVGPGRAATIWHALRHARCRAGQRARDAQHPRRTLGHLQRRFRPAPVARPAPQGRSADLRVFPAPSRCAGARGRIGQDLRPRARSCENADVWCRVLV